MATRFCASVAEPMIEILDRVGDEVLVEGALVLEVEILLPFADAVERGLRDVEVALLQHLGHLAEEEGEEQGPDVRAVDVGVGHQDDLVVAQLVDLEAAGVVDAAAERGDQGPHLGGAEHAVEAGALHVEDLALEREDGLEVPVTALLGAAPGALALDDVELALLRDPSTGSRRACPRAR